ncbi:hypothetical protein MPRF_54180 [Mycolicibacterium parafortuitum]|uniref:DUF3263 domain-containing protein n=1 Tax=Mycolicibacterium parafortuitum TaxID=39692 RepID=A0A7I7UCZ5_MYCPF|nr:hypothetical protein [Mycolicibacterium parafortuitum]PQD99575.1 hypothetical protein CYL16_15615 [Mycobacterium sp. EPG1]BBY78519.1 hypothetical protein MPRF_54180 [Mycolicibacterium parafortuitum]
MPEGEMADRFAHDIVAFMRSWAPYGGPPDDEVLPEFGMTRDQLIQRYRQIIDAEIAQREYERRHPWLALRRSASAQ